MPTEFEATFVEINKDTMRSKLTAVGAFLVRPEYLQTRVTFNLPPGQDQKTSWVRVRDEGDKITLSLKRVSGDKITDQEETCLVVNDFKMAIDLINSLGCQQKAFQESKRELWKLNEVEVTIDEWPFLEPFVEIEGDSEQAVRGVSEQLGFVWDKAKFCSVTTLYKEKYGVSDYQINDQTPKIVFGEANPFI